SRKEQRRGRRRPPASQGRTQVGHYRSPRHPLRWNGHRRRSKRIDALLAAEDDRDADTAPPVPENPVSRTGDLWVCGKGQAAHRILCGDSTSQESVARLLGERKPRLMVTDPPYV